MTIDRREFLKLSTAALATSALSMNARSYAAVVGANDRVRTAVDVRSIENRQALIAGGIVRCRGNRKRIALAVGAYVC